MNTITSIKGTQDILPERSFIWQQLETHLLTLSGQYGYKEIRTPIFEKTELFSRGIGELTDVVSKEMYTFHDRGGTSVTLRPEMTAGVMRSYIQNHLNQSGGIQKLTYLGPMFRAENVQKGRLRQFNQWGIECVGSASPLADAEVIDLLMSALTSLGLKKLELKINSVGDEKCRPAYRKALQDYFRPYIHQLCSACQNRLEKNPMRLLDCKVESCQQIAKNAPVIYDFFDPENKRHFDEVKQHLSQFNLPYTEDPFLVRGLDYYTKTAFEVISTDLGSQNAVGGGGRYDGLIEQLGGQSTPSVGFAVGIERLLILLEESGNLGVFNEKKPDLFVAVFKDIDFSSVLPVIKGLRANGFMVEIELLNRSIKAQMRDANRLGATYSVVIGESELSTLSANIKHMSTGKETLVPFSEWVSWFESIKK